MDKVLSEKLEEAGFLKVLGTMETAGGFIGEVGPGEPGRFDSNNGVSVVYDERGYPWIHRGWPVSPYSFGLSSEKCGAGVPHSNDGGAYIETLFPRN